MAVKINTIIQQTDCKGVLTTSWLEKQGISRTEQGQYVRSGWLRRIATGVYCFANTTPALYDTLASLDAQSGLHYRVGASSALELHGYTHYLSLGRPQAHVFTPADKRLPRWIEGQSFDMDVNEHSTKMFEGTVGQTSVEQNGMNLKASSPELAIMECLLLTPESYDMMDVFHLMESLTALRASLVTELLEKCVSVKVKRLFLYMAEKAGHAWLDRVDQNRITVLAGKNRAFSRLIFIHRLFPVRSAGSSVEWLSSIGRE